jgi:hypothetical protein
MSNTYKFPCGCEFPIVGERVASFNHPLVNWDILGNNTNLNCQGAWDLICSGFTKGIFQVESQLGRHWCKEIQPNCIEDLAAIGSLMRPGCLNSEMNGKSMTQHYADRKNGLEPVSKYHPILDEILSKTYGVLVYQEQTLEIAKRLAGFSLQEADTLRKGIGKKDAGVVAECKKLFIEKATTFGVISKEQAEEIFGWIEKSSRYQFNKCLSPNTIVETINKEYKTIEDIEIGEKIKAPNKEGTDKYVTVKNKYYNGKKRMYKTILESGKEIISTIDHKFLCENGEVLPLYEILSQNLKIVSDGV